jgi:N utilization substance protein B
MWDTQSTESIRTLYNWYCEEKKDACDILPSEFILTTLHNIVQQQLYIDNLLRQYAENWSLERIAKVDLAILRLAVYELQFTQTPTPVIINEAIELAKEYASEDSRRFINGVLDRVAKTSC